MVLLIEHYAGKYFFWLSLRLAIILSIDQDPEVLQHVAFLQAILSGFQPLNTLHYESLMQSTDLNPKLKP